MSGKKVEVDSVRKAKVVLDEVRDTLNYVPNDEVGSPIKWCIERICDVLDFLADTVEEIDEIVAELEENEDEVLECEEGIVEEIVNDLVKQVE